MNLKKEIEGLLNKASRENNSDTPDYILAEYLLLCLDAFEGAVNAREEWYGRKKKVVDGIPPWPQPNGPINPAVCDGNLGKVRADE